MTLFKTYGDHIFQTGGKPNNSQISNFYAVYYRQGMNAQIHGQDRFELENLETIALTF
jgi:hypothetical protein